MACQVFTKIFAASISLGGTSQPQTDSQLRRIRNRNIPSRASLKKPSILQRDAVTRNKGGSSIKFEGVGPHQRISRSLQSTIHLSTTAMDSGMRYTKTGRISKAQKGVRGAHACGCGKHYSRAEHLRRHQQNHETYLPCHVASCGKIFHRQDLLDRHLATRHNQEPAYSPRRRSDASCGSSYTQYGSVDNVIGTSVPVQAPLTAEIHYIPDISMPPQHYLQQTSINPSRYNQLFYNQPSDPISCSSFPSSDVIYAPIESNATIIKPDHSIPPESAWHQPASNLVTDLYQLRPFHSSDEDSTITHEFSELDGWIPVPDHYTFQTDLDQINIPYIPTGHPSSPHSNTTLDMKSLIPGVDQAPFLTSGESSPTSVASTALPPIIMPQSVKGIPLLFHVPRDKYVSLDLEGPLEDQQLGISLSLKTKQHYVESYWKYFHPMFPVLHRPSYQAQTPCPMLSAAVMCIGAQYDDGHFAKGDSRILHEKCQELISKYRSALWSAARLDYMQAIFLVEMFSHFKAKRATSQLSETFKNTYSQLGKQHGTISRLQLQDLAIIKPCTSESAIRQQWMEWIHVHSTERLLTACYILDTQQALLLARPTFTEASFGLDLYIPAYATLWEASVHTRWANLLRGSPPPLVTVSQLLNSMTQDDNHAQRCEPFQSGLLTACHASSVLAQRQEADNGPCGPAAVSHPIFETGNIALLEQALCPQANVLIAQSIVRLATHSPARALLAVSGESWVFSQRLSSGMLLAAAEFETLRTQLRSWSETLQQPTLWPASTATKSDAHEALQCALNIIRLALDMDSRNLAFGGEMAVFYSCLVLWASTFRAVCKAEAAGLKFEDDDTAEFAGPRAEQDARYFVELAESDINSSTMCDGIPPADRIDRWRFGVGAVLTWSAWVIGGAGLGSSGAGELMDGAVGVLERLGQRGWVGDWF